MSKRPNILFLMSDEHRADVTGFEGNPVVRTPVLDELARTGTVFLNAYTPSPICIPGRQAMMAGQFPRKCGAEVFNDDLAPGYMTFARRFSQYAYQTVVCGKLHHVGTDQMQGWMQRVGTDSPIHPKYIEGGIQEEFEKYVRPMRETKWSDTKEVLRAGPGRSPHQIKDEYSIAGALDFIDQHYNSSYYDKEQPQRPVLLKVSLLLPHYPYFTDEEKFGYYLNRVTPFLDEEPFDHPFLSQRQVRPGIDASEREIRRGTAAYYGMVETIDTLYGKVLDKLREVGQDPDDWIIIYTSDHGEMLGEHGIWEKQKFFEASARVPLIIRWPKRFGKTGRIVEENVNLCDLFATLCDFADIPSPEGLDSRSMIPLMKEDASHWDNETVSQFGGKNLMIKRDQLKYQYYGKDWPEVLFDLDADPGETKNHIDESRFQEQVAAFRCRRAELGFG
jgi:choline-sulfatase